MITVSKIANAGVALLNYYSERDDYYREGGGAPAAFAGRGAAELGLSGAMTTRRQAQQFADLLANGGGRKGGKDGNHTPGWDVTFSAPKSASVAALVGGDDRLIAAHERAVARALAHIEQHAIVTRQRGADGKGYEWRHGTGLIAATFRHATSRDVDPQLHTHTAIVNATRDPATGELRALDSRELYRAQSEAGATYTTELAAQCRALGYAVDFRIDANGHPQFELADVPPAIREQFSKRSAAIDTALAAVDKDRATASPAAKQAAAMATRAAKEHVDHATLRGRWQEEARSRDWGPTQRPLTLPPEQDPAKAAAAAVCQAAEHLAERDARFSARALEHEARLFAEGRANDDHIRAAIATLAEKGELQHLQHRDVQERAAGGRRALTAGFTTRTGIETETKMLRAAEVLRSRAATIGGPENVTAGQLHRAAAEAIRRTEISNDREFGDEQRAATTSILTEAKSIHVLHGHAGTAKTSSVLACVRDAAEREGYSVRAMAPTNAAAQKLGDSIQAAGHSTIASHLHRDALRSPFDSDRAPPTSGGKRELWIVDEAGMVSARDMQRLLSKAEREHASVVLVGDTKQLGSVEAGEAFEQLRSKLGSADLTDIKRQQDPQLREAVYDSLRGEVRAALSRVPVIEAKTRAERVVEITRQYMSQPSKEREETLVLAPGKDDRAQINDAIRAARRERGELGREATITVLEKSDLTPAALRQAARYQPGWILEADRRYEFGPMRGERGEVARIENGKVVVKLQRGGGEYEWKFDPRKTSGFQVYSGKRELAVAEGDKLVAKASLDAGKIHGGGDAVIKNGTPLDVVAVKDREIIVRDAGGVEMAIARNTPQQLDYGYAQTVHQAQGQDYAKAIGHLESRRENLSSLKSMYVALSRAREKFTIVTDNRDALAATLERNTGQKATALERPNEQTVTAPYELGKLAEYREPQGLAPTPPEPSTAPSPDPASVVPVPEPLPEIGGSPAPTPEPVPAAPEPQPEVTDSPAPAPEPGHEPSHDDGPAWG